MVAEHRGITDSGRWGISTATAARDPGTEPMGYWNLEAGKQYLQRPDDGSEWDKVRRMAPEHR